MQNDKILEQAIDFFENPEKYSEEELTLLFKDEDFVAAYKNLLDCKYALIKEYKSDTPDISKEWGRFEKSHSSTSKKINKLKVWINIAACFAVVISGYLLYENFTKAITSDIIVFQANNQYNNSGITLRTASGEEFVLEKGDTIGANTIITDKELIYNDNQNSKQDIHTLTTPAGKDYKIVLADSSIVWLNANSRLEYPSRFTGKERIVMLSGEAYFKVSPNKEKPFIVKTSTTTTRVLGTELNIKSYSSDDSHITLIKGIIEIKPQNKDLFISIKPGEDARLLNDGTFSVKKIDTDVYTYWKDGYFYFDNISLKDIMTNIGQWYNVNIIFKNTNAMHYKMRYIGKRDKGIDHILSLLNRMEKANITHVNNAIYVE